MGSHVDDEPQFETFDNRFDLKRVLTTIPEEDGLIPCTYIQLIKTP